MIIRILALFIGLLSLIFIFNTVLIAILDAIDRRHIGGPENDEEQWNSWRSGEEGKAIAWMEKPEAYHEEVTSNNQPSAQPECKAPISHEEQLSLDCSFCRQHECGDTLYESSDRDGGIGFDYIKDIRFCPICGRKLHGDK